MAAKQAKKPLVITQRLLAEWPLPQPDPGGNKEGRGQVLIVGGARVMPGAIILAATAALRAGAGKLQIATAESVAVALGAAIPEAYVLGLPELEDGSIDPRCADQIVELAGKAQAVLFGPGMINEDRVTELVRAVLPQLSETTVVLDAAALATPSADPASLHCLGGRVILTPHSTELALMRHLDRDAVTRDPLDAARAAAADLRAVVAHKGRDTFIVSPSGAAYHNKAGNVGLATSGSGDTLAGLVTGLAARGADPLHAAVWAVYLHAAAGDRLARRMGALGFLARELLAEVPVLMHKLTP